MGHLLWRAGQTNQAPIQKATGSRKRPSEPNYLNYNDGDRFEQQPEIAIYRWRSLHCNRNNFALHRFP